MSRSTGKIYKDEEVYTELKFLIDRLDKVSNVSAEMTELARLTWFNRREMSFAKLCAMIGFLQGFFSYETQREKRLFHRETDN